jgi:hypothetical protein
MKNKMKKAAKRKPAARKSEQAQPITAEEQSALAEYGALFVQDVAAEWHLGELTNQLQDAYSHRAPISKGNFVDVHDFYQRAVVPKFKDRAPSYATIAKYARVADTWPLNYALNIGMSKLGVIWTWIAANGWRASDYRKLENVQIDFKDPKTGQAVNKPVLDASVSEIQAAINPIKAQDQDPADRGNELLRVLDTALESHVEGGSALLATKGHGEKMAYGLRAVSGEQFPGLIKDLYAALVKEGFIRASAGARPKAA